MFEDVAGLPGSETFSRVVAGGLTQGWNEPPIGAEYANGCAPNYMHFRKVSIYSGSNQNQHNIIAKAGLGL